MQASKATNVEHRLQTAARQYFPMPGERLRSRLAHTLGSQLAICSSHLLCCGTLVESLNLSSPEKHLAMTAIGFTVVIAIF